MSRPLDLLHSDRLRGAARVLISVLLLVIAWQVHELVEQREDEKVKRSALEAFAAGTCGAATFEELERLGLVEECKLAQEGKLGEALPEDDLPSPGADPSDLDVLDDGDTDRSDVTPAPLPRGPSNAQVEAAVDSFFDQNPLATSPTYQSSIRRSVSTYLSRNPPEPGRPPTQREVRNAVQAALLANPPQPGEDGTDGTNGRGVTGSSIDGCDVVFTYNDGTTSRVGPLCGPRGETGPPPSAETIRDALTAYCDANGGCVGPPGVVNVVDLCRPVEFGEQITDVNLSPPENGTITQSCTYGSVLGGGNGGGNGGEGDAP